MNNPWTMSILVGLGGFAGSVARFGLSAASQRLSVTWPLGTLGANVLGCFIIGIIAGCSSRGETIPPALRLALATGFCGGFTTLSSLIYETADMFRAGEHLHASLYAAGTFLLSMAAFIVGVMAVRMVLRISLGSV